MGTDLRLAQSQAWDAYSDVLRRASPENRALAQDTAMFVDHAPRDWELRSVGLTAQDRERLLGIYYTDPSRGIRPTIVLYADAMAAQRVSVRDVLWHEMGHRFSRDHQIRAAAAACTAHQGAIVDAGADAIATLPADQAITWTSGCPVCLLHDRTAVARCLSIGIAHSAAVQAARPTMEWSSGSPWWAVHDDLAIARCLAEGLNFEAQLDHRIPPGLGGTVPGIRHHLERAAAGFDALAPSLTADEHDRLAVAVAIATQAWTGAATPDTAGPGADACVLAWELAFAAAARLAPGEAAPRLRHALAEASSLITLVAAMADASGVRCAVAEAVRDCASGPPVCSAAADAAWWASYRLAEAYFARGRH